jgi:hypothetical protein
MKGLLLLQRRFAQIGHPMAVTLKEKYGINEFCTYVYKRSSLEYLKHQDDINYSSLILDEDVHKKYKDEKIDLDFLKNLEEEYGIPHLWPYIAVDRVLMSNQLVREYPHNKPPVSHETMIKILQVHAKTILEMLEQEKPDFVFCSVVGALGNLLIYHIAKKKGIKVLVALPTLIGHRWVLSEKFDHCTYVDEKFKLKDGLKDPSYTEAKKFLEKFREKPTSYSQFIEGYRKRANRLSSFTFFLPKNAYRSIKWFITICKKYVKQRKFQDYSYDNHPWFYLVDRVKRKIRNLIGFSDLVDPINAEEDFAFFPLHYEPEIALLLHAPYYTDQIFVIKHIAKSLPLHYKLYVKEHPAMVPFRPRKFYKEIKKIPNVKLISPKVGSFSIIPLAKLIVTITGSAGWEAHLLKKPVITLGNQFYNTLPGITKCENPKDLAKTIKETLQNYKHNEEELLFFLQSIIEDSAPVDLAYIWEHEWDMEKRSNLLEPLVDLLAKKLNIQKNTD